jgi:hypothetical protein
VRPRVRVIDWKPGRNADPVARLAAAGAALTIWFVRSRAQLEGGMRKMVTAAEKGGLWIAWPKKSSRLAGDVTETHVRQIGLATGLVDFKVCAIDETWSGGCVSAGARGIRGDSICGRAAFVKHSAAVAPLESPK